MKLEVKGFSAVTRLVALLTLTVAGVVVFLLCQTATLLGGLTRLPRTLPDWQLTVLYLSGLVVLLPLVAFLSRKKWHRVHRNDHVQAWTRFLKCLTIMFVGGGIALIFKAVIQVWLREFDNELPTAGILYLCGAFCCLEYLRDYRVVPSERPLVSARQQCQRYLFIAAAAIAVTAAFLAYMFATDRLR